MCSVGFRKDRALTPPEDSFLPFSLPDVGEEEIAEVSDALRTGWLTTGPRVRRFEDDFARYLGSDVQALAVNSATAGLHLALEAAGIRSGDEVITTVYTFTATAEVTRYLGANPAFVDVRADTLNIDPDAIEAAINQRTKAIIPVHFAGLPCDMDVILKIASRHGLRVIEDAAHALPAKSGGALIGTLGSSATVFSFYATKTLATGEGGMIVTRDPQLAARCRIMRLHGIDRDAFGRYAPSPEPSWHYRVVAPGYKYNMTDIAAAIGIHQLRKQDRFLRRREELARRYHEELHDLCLQLPACAPAGDVHAWHLYVVRLNDDAPVSRDDFIAEMAAAGIGTSVHFIPLHLHPYWRDTFGLRPEAFPNAARAYPSVVSLPIYTRMTDGDQERVVRTIRSILGRPCRSFAALPALQPDKSSAEAIL